MAPKTPTPLSADAPARTGLAATLWPLLVLAGLCAVFFCRLLWSPARERLAGEDITEYLYWLNQYARDEILSGRWPLWIPYVYCGMPFAANPHCTLFYPPSWLYLAVGVSTGHKLSIVLHCLLAGAFLYLFLRRHALPTSAALAGCLPWMFGSYVMAHAMTGHLTLLFTMAWLPLLLYCYDRSLEDGPRWLFWSGFVLGVQLLAGEPQTTFYTGLLLGLYSLVRSAGRAVPGESRWSPVRYGRWAGGLAAIVAVAALTGAVQLLMTAEFTRHSDRSANTYAFATAGSMAPASLAGLLVPWSPDVRGVRFGPSGPSGPFIDLYWEYAIYAGILPLVLAAVALPHRRTPVLAPARLVLVVAVVIMLGSHTPIYRFLFDWLPGLRFFRAPARAWLMALWAVSVMSACGAAWLIRSRTGPPPRPWWRFAAIAGLAAVAIGLVTTVVLANPVQFKVPFPRLPEQGIQAERLRLSDPLVLRPAACLLISLTVLAAMRRIPARFVGPVLVAAVAADLLIARPAFVLETYDPQQDARLNLVKQLQEKGGAAATRPFRVDLCASLIGPDAAIGARAENVNGRWPMGLRRLYRFAHEMRDRRIDPWTRHQLPDYLYAAGHPFALRVLNVQYVSVLDLARQRGTFARDRNFLPRAWVADRIEVLDDEEAILRRMKQPDFDPARTVILERAPSLAVAPGGREPGTCRVYRHENGNLDVATDTTRDGYLVLSAVHYPGWRATIDGRAVDLERADYVITALPLPAGRHEVKFRYDPWSFKAGAAATVLSCLAAGVLRVRARRHRPGGPGGGAPAPAKL